jgi:two-component system probable response regulator PhcQ
MSDRDKDRQFHILYVDDEELALKNFRKAFGKEFNILTAASARAAADILRDKADDIAVLITDQRMPERTGVDLLREVRREHPAIVRILTTAYSDLSSAIDAVNAGAIFRYIAKPWDLRDLRGVLLGAIEFFNLQRERDLLLCEKLSVLQRMLVLDRARGLITFAAGLDGRLRHPLHGVRAYLAFAGGRRELTAASPAAGWDDLWAMTIDESDSMLAAVGKVLDATKPNGFSPVNVSDLSDEVGEGLSQLTADGDMLRRVLGVVRAAVGRSAGDATVSARGATIHGRPAVRFTSRFDGPGLAVGEVLAALSLLGRPAGSAPTDADLLPAFLAAAHHGGELEVDPEAPGITLTVPVDAEVAPLPPLEQGWLDAILERFEA